MAIQRKSPIHEPGYPGNQPPASSEHDDERDEGKGHSDYSLDKAATDKLVTFAKRILEIREEKKTLADDEKEEFKAAKAMGFDAAALRQALSALAKDKQEREEAEQLRDLYILTLEERL